jgi:MFS family permease
MPSRSSAAFRRVGRATLSSTGASLRIRNFRVYFIGQVISFAGTWMQRVGQAILTLQIGGSGTTLGLVLAVQMLPVLLFSVWTGPFVDRIAKRRILFVTQTVSAVSALGLAVLVGTGRAELWMVYASAALLGLAQLFDHPARQSIVPEMVGDELLANALSLNSVMINLARVVGPGLAGLTIAWLGIAACFYINAASYLAVLLALAAIRTDELVPVIRKAKRASAMEGFRYVARTPAVRWPLLMMTIIGTLGYEFQVTLPLLAERTFGNPASYGTMSAMQGLGAIIGGLVVASRYRGRKRVTFSYVAIAFGVLFTGVALAPTLTLALIACALMGSMSTALLSVGNTTVQLATDPDTRGQVMSMWSMALLGTTVVGGPFVGWIGEHFGARYSIAVGGLSAIGAGLAGLAALRRLDLRQPVVIA